MPNLIPITVPVELTSSRVTVPVSVASSIEPINVTLGYVVNVIGADNYEGSYEYTPTQETQIIPIEGLRAVQDITINPIPSNYGLITWNGATLTVS